MFRVVFCLLLLLGGALPASRAESPPSAAACVIRHQQALLLVQDRISDRYSLSGGYIDGGETSAQAALRELFEETGLHGRITGELGRWQRATVFACQTLTPIRAQRGSGFVSLLQAPNLGGEILNARLIDVASLPHDQRRFPTQLDWLAPRLAQVPESEVQWVPDFSPEGNALHRAELPLIQRLQQWLGPDARWLEVGNLLVKLLDLGVCGVVCIVRVGYFSTSLIELVALLLTNLDESVVLSLLVGLGLLGLLACGLGGVALADGGVVFLAYRIICRLGRCHGGVGGVGGRAGSAPRQRRLPAVPQASRDPRRRADRFRAGAAPPQDAHPLEAAVDSARRALCARTDRLPDMTGSRAPQGLHGSRCSSVCGDDQSVNGVPPGGAARGSACRASRPAAESHWRTVVQGVSEFLCVRLIEPSLIS